MRVSEGVVAAVWGCTDRMCGAAFHAATTASSGTVEKIRGRSRERSGSPPVQRRSGVCLCVCVGAAASLIPL